MLEIEVGTNPNKKWGIESIKIKERND